MFITFAFVTLSSSCKKDDVIAAVTGGPGSLGAGKSTISFNTLANYAGSTSFLQSNTPTTHALSISSAVLRNISLSATEISGTNTRAVMMMIIVPGNASTTSGNLTGDFSLPNGVNILPGITLNSTAGGTTGITFGTQTGTCNITKLTTPKLKGPSAML